MVFIPVFIEHVLLEVQQFRVSAKPLVSGEILRLVQHSVLVILHEHLLLGFVVLATPLLVSAL